jgi:repressor LexA
MAKEELTRRQQQILDYIQECITENQCPPSVREIAQAVGLASPSTVHAHLSVLEQKGYIHRKGAKSRAMSVVRTSARPSASTRAGTDAAEKDAGKVRRIPSAGQADVVKLPLVGRVAAGAPILAEQNVEEEVPLPRSMFGDANSYLLGVHGQSMIDAGIHDGDIVVVREQHTADDGQIVVALLDGEATVKTFYREKDCVRLQPQNEAMEPIYTTDAQVIGVVTGLFRTM